MELPILKVPKDWEERSGGSGANCWVFNLNIKFYLLFLEDDMVKNFVLNVNLRWSLDTQMSLVISFIYKSRTQV